MTLTVTESIRHAERHFAGSEAAVCGDTRLTYADFGERCRRLASGLRDIGIRPGDRIAVLMANCHRYLEAYTAIPAIGAVIVPLNTRQTAVEQRMILADCAVRLLIVDERHRQIADELDSSAFDVLHAPDEYEQLLQASSPATFDDDPGEDDLAAIFYTGGTTGAPKGVMLSHRNLVANAFNITIGAGYNEFDTFLHAAPMFHLADGSSIYALTWRGARHVILPAFDPAAVLEMIERERITCTIMVPTMIHAIVNHPQIATADPSSLRLIVHGGAPIAPDLLRQANERLGCSLCQAYGLTEGSSHIALLPNEERLLDDKLRYSAGRAVMGCEIVIRDPDGTGCPPDKVGEVTVRGPNLTAGYWNRPVETSAALRDGWFWTGDLARMDDAGYIYIVDRAKDMIITGGENVFSIEVEDALTAHPAVSSVAVIGVPDERWGERVHAVVVPRSGCAVELEELRAFCACRIAGYKCPQSMDLIDKLPMSGAGKVLKQPLREPYWAGQQRQVH